MKKQPPLIAQALLLICWQVAIFGVCLLLTSCATSKRQAELDRLLSDHARAGQHHAALRREPYADSAARRPALTPRQERRLELVKGKAAARVAKASAPRRIGKNAVYAPQAREVAVIQRTRGPVAAGDSATAIEVGKNKGAQAVGSPGAVVTNTPPAKSGCPWWLYLVAVVLALLGLNRLLRGR